MSFPESRGSVESRSIDKSQTRDRRGSKNRRRALASLVAAITLVDCTSRLHATTQTSTWVGVTNTSWNTATNWNPTNTFPDNGNASISDFDVVINSVTSPDVAPLLNTSVTIDGLNLGVGAALSIQGSSNLTINDNVVNDGGITVNSNNSSVSTLSFASGTLSGTGTVTLNSGGTGATVAGTLTLASGGTVNGLGEINAALTNNGTVDASVNSQTLTLLTSAMTNNNLMEATSGGILNISGITVSQGSTGQVSASGSTVNLVAGATISGGTLNTSSGGVIAATSSSTDTLANVTNNGTLDIVGSSNINITGNLTDNGAVVVNSNNSSASTITFASGILSGTGTMTLNSSGTDAVVSGTLTQSSGHTIMGLGEINAAITNNGTIDSSVNGQTLTLLTSNMTNNSLMEATGGGVLSISGITVSQGAAGQISASGSTVDIVGGAEISNGVLNTLSGGVIAATNSSIDTLASVTNNGTLDIVGASDLNITGNLVDNGTINVNSNNSNFSTMTFNGGTLSGTGTITLNSASTNADIAGTLIQSSGHTIDGFGAITAGLTNHGLVNASTTGQTLFVSGATVTNTSTMEATNGTLAFNSGVAVTNTGGIINANGANVVLNNASITGGTLEATSPDVILVQGATFSGTTITANTTVDVQGSFNLNLTGSTLTNNGTINVNYNNSNFSTLQVNSVELLTGSGNVTLSSASTGAVIVTGVGDTLTQDVHHTIEGFGEIAASLINNGTVDANVSSQALTLLTANMTNNSVMEATGGGDLNISGITLTQVSPGQISASGTSSLVTLVAGATISGGTLNTSSGGLIQVTNSSVNTLANVTNNGTLNIVGSSGLNITGNLVDDGVITVNSNNSNFSTMTFSGGTLSGTGTITLNGATTQAVLAGTLIQSSGHTIDGYGEITGALTNNATVNASVSAQTLTLLTNNMTNNSLMEATGGAILAISGITLTQVSPGQLSASGTSSLIALINGATVSGGTLNTSTGGIFQVTNASTDTLANVTNNGTFNILGQSGLNVTGNLANNGTITVNSNDSNFSTMTFSGGTLSGTGTITLNSGSIGAVIAGTLTQSSGHTVNGYGEITAALTNNGTVNASVSGQTLTLTTGPMINHGLMEATGGGTLAIGAVTITQNSAGQINPSTGTVQFTGGATVTGGTLGAGTINNTSGTNTIGGLTNNATLNVIGSTNLNISSAIVNNGVLSVDSNTSSSSTVNASGAITGTGAISIQSGGKLAFAPNLAPSTQASLSITGSGVLDINNNKLFIDYGSGPDPIASIEQWIENGFNNQFPAIVSSAIATDDSTSGLSYGIGYADGKDGEVAGLPSGEIEIMFTLLGDANLDGTVNAEDFTPFSHNLGQSGMMWDDGDFNYDGTVNAEDFTPFSHNLGKTAVLASQAGGLESANSISLTNVPEPASMAMIAIAGFGILRRRRRSAP